MPKRLWFLEILLKIKKNCYTIAIIISEFNQKERALVSPKQAVFRQMTSATLMRVLAWICVAFLATAAQAVPRDSAPRGGRIEAGAGNLTDPFNIKQESAYLATSWQSFDIAKGKTVRITQPSATALISIKVRNGAATNISGTLRANGRVSLENPAGVRFNEGSVVNVGGLLASARAGDVVALGTIKAKGGRVHFQSAAKNNVINLGGYAQAKEIIVEGANEVRVKSGANLSANKVLIGGDYQGGGDIINARTTIIEKDTLITSSYVVVWADGSTYFNGSINAQGGFVEISAKNYLAPFDIFSIQAKDLLIDPNNISIDLVGINDNQVAIDGIVILADGANSNFSISASTIENYNGNVSLIARQIIAVNAPINKTNGGLTLIGTNININQSISTTESLIITAEEHLSFTTGNAVTLSADIVSLTSTQQPTPSNRNLTVTANDRLILGGKTSINLGSAATFEINTKELVFPLESTIDINVGQITLNLNSSSFIAIAKWMIGDGRSTTIRNSNTDAQSGIVISSNINLGLGHFVVEGNAITIESNIFVNAGSISLIARQTKSDTLDAIYNILEASASFVATTGDLTINAYNMDFRGHNGGIGRGNLGLSATGNVVFLQDISIQAYNINIGGGTLKAESIQTGIATRHNLTLSANDAINFATGASTTIQGADVFLTSTQPPLASGQDLTIETEGVLSLVGFFSISTSNDLTLITHTFEGSPTFTRGNTNLFLDGQEDTIIPDWVGRKNGDLTITSRLTADIILSGTLDLASGNLTANAQNSAVSFDKDAPTTIIATNISLTSFEPTANNQNVTITATGRLTLAGLFDIGSGNLTLNVNELFTPSPAVQVEFIRNELSVNFTGALFAFPDWLQLSDKKLTVTAQTIDILFPLGINIGSGDLVVNAVAGAINFSTAVDTSLIANDITLTAATASTPSNQALRIEAKGDVTLNAQLDVGSGAMDITAGDGANNEGEIIFMPSTILTANAGIALRQDKTPFPSAAPSSFVGEVTIYYKDEVNPNFIGAWAQDGNGEFGADVILDAGDDDIIITDDLLFQFGHEIDSQGILNMASYSLSLETTGSIIFPANLRGISANSVSLTAASIDGINGDFIINAFNNGDIFLGADIDNGEHDLALLATGSISFSTTAQITLSGRKVILFSRIAAATPSNQELTVNATNDIEVEGSLNIGSGALRFVAGAGNSGNNIGKITFLPNTTIIANGGIQLFQKADAFPSLSPATFVGDTTIFYRTYRNPNDVSLWATDGFFHIRGPVIRPPIPPILPPTTPPTSPGVLPLELSVITIIIHVPVDLPIAPLNSKSGVPPLAAGKGITVIGDTEDVIIIYASNQKGTRMTSSTSNALLEDGIKDIIFGKDITKIKRKDVTLFCRPVARSKPVDLEKLVKPLCGSRHARDGSDIYYWKFSKNNKRGKSASGAPLSISEAEARMHPLSSALGHCRANYASYNLSRICFSFSNKNRSNYDTVFIIRKR